MTATQTILAFDYGRRRIGVAVGQSITASASPLCVVSNTEQGPDYATIDALVREWRPTELVVGLPTHADGSPGPLHAEVERFVSNLEQHAVPIALVDERYTSIEAEAALKNARASGRRGRISKADIDSAAAVFIAERYLSSG